MYIKRGIDKAVETVVAELKKLSKDVKDNKEIEQVATISANGDTEIGKIIAECMDKVGKDGTITVEEARSIETTKEIVEGMEFDKGYISPYFVTEKDTMQAVIEATRRLCGNEEDQRSRALPRDDHLLLVPTRESTRLHCGMRSAYVKGLHEVGRVGGDGSGMPDHPVCKRLLIVGVQHEIIGNGIALDHPMFMAVFRNMRHTACGQLPWRCLGDVGPLEDDAASHRVPEPRQRFDQLRLPVALDASDAEDFASVHGQRYPRNRQVAAFIAHVEVAHIEDYLAGDRTRLFHHLRGTRLANHQCSKLGCRGLGWRQGAHQPPPA